MNWTLPNDPFGAFCRGNHIATEGSGKGPLSGLTFAAKDVFAIAGSITGFGHPEWLRTHTAETVTASAVQRILDAGATLAGKTLTDELTYSLTGENHHYGTPRNPHDAARVPGGSSSGSAVAVAAALVDFSLGSDCGGSVRVPASYCGVFGIRTTHGRIPLDGAVPFAPSFDCVGWFARSADMMLKVAKVLLDEPAPTARFNRFILCVDGFATPSRDIQEALMPNVARMERILGSVEPVTIAADGLDAWSETFRIIQAFEIWQSLGDWIRANNPEFGPGVRERMARAAMIDQEAADSARAHRNAIAARMDAVLTPESVLCLPTTPRTAPHRGLPTDDVEVEFRHQAMNLSCIAGLAGLPQVSMPIAAHDGLPIGLSLVGPKGSDMALLRLAKIVCEGP